MLVDMKPYEGKLSDEERKALQRMVSSGSGAARAIRRAQMLLTSEEGWTERALFYTDHYTVYKGVIPPAQHRAISKLARKTNHADASTAHYGNGSRGWCGPRCRSPRSSAIMLELSNTSSVPSRLISSPDETSLIDAPRAGSSRVADSGRFLRRH